MASSFDSIGDLHIVWLASSKKAGCHVGKTYACKSRVASSRIRDASVSADIYVVQAVDLGIRIGNRCVWVSSKSRSTLIGVSEMTFNNNRDCTRTVICRTRPGS
jgi:hypothetical protein